MAPIFPFEANSPISIRSQFDRFPFEANFPSFPFEANFEAREPEPGMGGPMLFRFHNKRDSIVHVVKLLILRAESEVIRA